MKRPNWERRTEILETCFECFCEHGIASTGTKKLAAANNMSTANLFNYFDSIDQIITESTAHCMEKAEEDFMAQAPQNLSDVERFLWEMPYLTAKMHGSKYRFMYQVYASPKYRECGKVFFKGVTARYTEYAKQLEPKLGIPWKDLQPLIFIFARACVHYALFEDDDYLRPQLWLIGEAVKLLARRDNCPLEISASACGGLCRQSLNAEIQGRGKGDRNGAGEEVQNRACVADGVDVAAGQCTGAGGE